MERLVVSFACRNEPVLRSAERAAPQTVNRTVSATHRWNATSGDLDKIHEVSRLSADHTRTPNRIEAEQIPAVEPERAQRADMLHGEVLQSTPPVRRA